MVAPHLARGRWGEDLAARWYARRGYTVVARNWRCSFGEVDLVARRGRLLVVAEVKTRRTDLHGSGAHAVGWEKRRRLRRLAAEWLRSTGTAGVDVRFDVVTVTGDAIAVIEAAF